MTRTNATRIALPLSIILERPGFEDPYRRITGIGAIAIALVGGVFLQLLLDNNDGLGRVSS